MDDLCKCGAPSTGVVTVEDVPICDACFAVAYGHEPPWHGTCSAGAPSFCGATDGYCMDTSVSMTHEDGRDLTCLACRAAWLAIPTVEQAERQ